MLEDGKQGEIVVLKGQRSSSMKNVEKIFHDAMLLDTMRKTSLTLPTSMVETTLKGTASSRMGKNYCHLQIYHTTKFCLEWISFY